jgi:hypothetical protein
MCPVNRFLLICLGGKHLRANITLFSFSKKPKETPQLGVKRASELVAKAFSPEEDVSMFMVSMLPITFS